VNCRAARAWCSSHQLQCVAGAETLFAVIDTGFVAVLQSIGLRTYVILAAAPSSLADGALLFLSNWKNFSDSASQPSIVTLALVALLRLGMSCSCGGLTGFLFSNCSVESRRMPGMLLLLGCARLAVVVLHRSDYIMGLCDVLVSSFAKAHVHASRCCGVHQCSHEERLLNALTTNITGKGVTFFHQCSHEEQLINVLQPISQARVSPFFTKSFWIQLSQFKHSTAHSSNSTLIVPYLLTSLARAPSQEISLKIGGNGFPTVSNGLPMHVTLSSTGSERASGCY
jgi:hypothetical protein